MSKTIAAAYAEATSLLHMMNEQVPGSLAEMTTLAARFDRAVEEALSRDPRTTADVLQQLELSLIGMENARDELSGAARTVVDNAISTFHGALRCLPDQAAAGALR